MKSGADVKMTPELDAIKNCVPPASWEAVQTAIDAQIAEAKEEGMAANSWGALWAGARRSKAMGLSLLGALTAAWGMYSDQIIPIVQAQVDPKAWPPILLAFSFGTAVIRAMTTKSLEEKGTTS